MFSDEVRIRTIVLSLCVAAGSSCTGSGGDCDAVPLAAIGLGAASIRATSCAPSVVLGGTTYGQWGGCRPVRDALLGPIEGRSENGGYVARSIEGVPSGTALAIREPAIRPSEACHGWQFWADGELIDRDKPAVNRLVRRVTASGEVS